MSRRFIAEFSVVTGNAELFDQSERREQLRFFEQHLSKHLLVEKVEAPWAEPDEVNEEDGCEEKEKSDDSEKPSKEAFEHAGVLPADPVSGQSKLRADPDYPGRRPFFTQSRARGTSGAARLPDSPHLSITSAAA